VPRSVLLATTADPETSIISEDPELESEIMPTTYSSWVDEVEAADLAELKAKSSDDKEEELADEELVDYEESPTRLGMYINMVYYLPAEFQAVDEDGEVA
jgi:hypothetical protein